MKHGSFLLGLLFLFVMLGSGCDSGQNGEETKTEPKAETPPAEEIPMPAGGALNAPEGATGAADNDEGVSHYVQGEGHYDVAQEHFQKALAANADLVEAHYNLALALDKLGKHGDAKDHFKMALDLAPEDPRIRDSAILKAHVEG
ncbi:MAG: tetratricopeptide repeat protein [Nitrospirota bacterium]|nr:tetratricopeptide repeat protein [Nitrospirota bacterium]